MQSKQFKINWLDKTLLKYLNQNCIYTETIENKRKPKLKVKIVIDLYRLTDHHCYVISSYSELKRNLQLFITAHNYGQTKVYIRSTYNGSDFSRMQQMEHFTILADEKKKKTNAGVIWWISWG